MWASTPAIVTVTAMLSGADNALMLNRQSDLDFGFLVNLPRKLRGTSTIQKRARMS